MPELRRLATTLVAAAAFGMPCAVAQATQTSQARQASQARVDFRFQDTRIAESSGLALSDRHPHTVWTVNDSGDSARVFAVDTRSGATVGVHTFDATVRDAEALAITPQGRMLVADIGDNAGTRTVVRIFWFDEPALGATTAGGARTASWELSYPDGPHDAESLAVDPRSGRMLIVTKGRPGGVYALPSSPSRSGVNRLTKVGSAPSLATDAVFLPDGSALAVRTYTSLHLLDPRSWDDVLSTVLPLQPQGETLAVAPGGAALLVGSEGEGSRVQEVSMPRVPSAPGRTTPVPSPAPSPTSGSPPKPPVSSPNPATDAPTPLPAVGSSSSGSAGASGRPLTVDRGELVVGLGASAGLVLLSVLVVRVVGRHRR